MVKLVDAGADVNEKDPLGCSPLIWAARSGHFELINYFVEKGADVEIAGYGGMRALHHAANNMKEPAIEALLKAGANVTTRDGKCVCACVCIHALIACQDATVINCGLGYLIDLGNEPLHIAAARGALSQCVVLIEAGGDLSSVNKNGTTPLMRSSTTGQTGCVERFIKLKPDTVEDKDNDGNTALHLAARSNMCKMVAMLVAERSIKDSKNKAGKTPMDLVGASFKKEMAPLLE